MELYGCRHGRSLSKLYLAKLLFSDLKTRSIIKAGQKAFALILRPTPCIALEKLLVLNVLQTKIFRHVFRTLRMMNSSMVPLLL